MSLIQGNASKVNTTAFYPKTIDQSLRFNDADLPHLFWEPNDTPDGGGQKFTISFWMKRADLDNYQTVYAARTAALAQSYWLIALAPNQLYIQGGYGANMNLTPTGFHRDPSAWYHIVVAADTTQATASNRVKLYINGEQVTSFSTETYPSQNADLGVLSTTIDQYIGRQAAQQYFDGYLTEFIIVDNQQLAPTDFGETKAGIWIPKEYSGTYGQGTHLDFANSASIGNDVSGNNHDWIPNNFTASDVVPDSPTNNFATLNSVEFVNNSGYLSEGNLKISDTSSANLTASGGTIGMKSGKWYWEAHLSVQENGFNIGVVKDTESVTSGTWNYTKTNFYAINGIGTSYVSDGAGSQNAAGTTFAQGDTVQVAYDADTGKLYFGKNGTWLNSADPAAGTGNLETTSDPAYGYHPATSTIGDASGYSDVIMNFGQDSTFAGNLTAGGNTDANGIGDFKYTVPSGYLALCTSNLPDPVIDPAQGASPEDYFNTVTYIGNETGQTFDLGSMGSVDFVWSKCRNLPLDHGLFDRLRGDNILSSNSTAAESSGTYITFGDGEFSWTGGQDPTNDNDESYVAWVWSANGSGVSNTDGSITSTVSANTTSGFSIVSYQGQTTADTVGHGLTQAPDWIVVKNRNTGNEWAHYHSALGADTFMYFTTAAATSGNTSVWNNTAPTSSVFSIGTSDATSGQISGDNMIAYCFHSVDGFSKFGSFVANGVSGDGSFVYLGFRPAFLMVKCTTTAEKWIMMDSTRSTYNLVNTNLTANASDAEQTSDRLDFLSNGFKVRASSAGIPNTSGATYIYMAFAEDGGAFKYSRAR